MVSGQNLESHKKLGKLSGNKSVDGYLLFIYSRFVYNYNINNYIEDYRHNLSKYKKYISKKNYNLYFSTINLLGQ